LRLGRSRLAPCHGGVDHMITQKRCADEFACTPFLYPTTGENRKHHIRPSIFKKIRIEKKDSAPMYDKHTGRRVFSAMASVHWRL
ncbi:hypothetical protein ACFQ5D_24425, partial [Paenibacillus farraposensis]